MDKELLKRFEQSRKHTKYKKHKDINQLQDGDVFLILHKREATLIKHLLIKEKKFNTISQPKLKVINNLIHLMTQIEDEEIP